MTGVTLATATLVHCARCGSQLAPRLLVCPACHTLVHAERLKQLAADAQAAETAGDVTKALERWREAISLLPPDSPQYPIISARIATLGKNTPSIEQTRQKEKEAKVRSRFGNGKVGSVLGAIAVVLLKAKWVIVMLLTKMKLLLLGFSKLGTLLSMLATIGVYWAMWGWPFAVGFVLSIYVHEMGHVSALRHYGVRAGAPMFIPGVGAFVRLGEALHSDWENAMVGLAGPLWGLAATAASYAAYLATDRPIFAAIAHSAAWLNLFNLLPVWQLDGGRGFAAMARTHRLVAAGAVLAAFGVTHDGLLLVVGGVAAVIAFGKPSRDPDARVAAYYVALAWALAGLSYLAAPVAQAVHALR
ncbi:MAG: site-2 protease family protein [Gemmatimonadota bacterium]|nr:site-2 protease family protein [Gemmatimonadota bacterium]